MDRSQDWKFIAAVPSPEALPSVEDLSPAALSANRGRIRFWLHLALTDADTERARCLASMLEEWT